MLCAFFKQGQCTKGDKCKFSHDLSMERKCEKRSVYVDERDEDLEKGQCIVQVTRMYYRLWVVLQYRLIILALTLFIFYALSLDLSGYVCSKDAPYFVL